MKQQILITICLCLFFVGCTTTKSDFDTTKLSDLQAMNEKAAHKKNKFSVDNLRTEGLRETALRLGAQAGLAWKAKQYDAMLEKNHQDLDQIFNFNALLLEHNVLPPVLVEAKHQINAEGDGTVLRISDNSYKIEKQARFATTVPNWRSYLWLDFKKPEAPDVTLLPRNTKEQAVWKRFIAVGWDEGIKQANKIYRDNLAEIRRDYQGMVIYRKLLAQKMVTLPFVAKTELGVTGGGDSMSINDQILRIAALPTLKANAKEWEPAVARND